MYLTFDKYVGQKFLEATPMDLGTYNEYRGWTIPADEDPETMGYLVKYEHGYESWSPAEQFMEAYCQLDSMDFQGALACLKAGKKVGRSGWNGKGMFLFLVPGSEFEVNRPPLLGIYPEGTHISYHSHIDMVTAQGTVVPWLCSQTDMLADDWEVVE